MAAVFIDPLYRIVRPDAVNVCRPMDDENMIDADNQEKVGCAVLMRVNLFHKKDRGAHAAKATVIIVVSGKQGGAKSATGGVGVAFPVTAPNKEVY
jgi:hypothetical protein